MATSFGAICNDFYINHKLALKLDLPSSRDTLLHLFDRVRKRLPVMNRLRRYDTELALESTRSNQSDEFRWLALRRNSIRTGHVNPPSMPQGYELHKLILEQAPYHLSISPLDVSYLELMFGFDLECKTGHDEVVYEALYNQSPVATILRGAGQRVTDVQPMFGMTLQDETSGELQCFFDVKTRLKAKRGKARRFRDDPISILLTLRKYGPLESVEDLGPTFDRLAAKAELLTVEQLIPHLLTPIARQITSNNA